MKKQQLLGTSIIALFLLSMSASVLATTIATDPPNDMRAFNVEWLNANIAADIDDWEASLNTIYLGLRNNWDNPEASRPLNARQYNRFNYIDILSVVITGLDEVNATLTINMVGDIGSAAYPWLIFIWSNCSGQPSGLSIIAIGGISGIGGDESLMSGYMVTSGNESVNNTMDFGAGNELNMEFPSDWWDDSDTTCVLRIITITADMDADPDTFYFDIYPNAPEPFPWWWLWLILILLAVFVIYYIYRRSKRTRASKKPTSRQVKMRG